MARLKPGVNLKQAEAEIKSISQRLTESYPETNGTVGARLIQLERQITGDVRPSLLLVWAAVGLVLLIACANVAHLLLARLEERQEEMAIRFALGASAGHLIRHVLSESLMLSAVGGAAGTGLALCMNGILRNIAQGQIPRLEERNRRAGLDFCGRRFYSLRATVRITGVLGGPPTPQKNRNWANGHARKYPDGLYHDRRRSDLGVCRARRRGTPAAELLQFC